jgi:hypothetical protein
MNTLLLATLLFASTHHQPVVHINVPHFYWYVQFRSTALVVHKTPVHHAPPHKKRITAKPPQPKAAPGKVVDLLEYNPDESGSKHFRINTNEIESLDTCKPEDDKPTQTKLTTKSGDEIVLCGSVEQVKAEIQRQLTAPPAKRKQPPRHIASENKPQKPCHT